MSIDGLPLVKGIVERNILIYGNDIQEGEHVGVLAKRSFEKFEKQKRENAEIQQPYH